MFSEVCFPNPNSMEKLGVAVPQYNAFVLMAIVCPCDTEMRTRMKKRQFHIVVLFIFIHVYSLFIRM